MKQLILTTETGFNIHNNPKRLRFAMGFLHTNKILIENAIKLRVDELVKEGHLTPNRQTTATIIWQKKGITTASITVISYCAERTFCTLKFKKGDTIITQGIDFISINSNLKQGGKIWYFLCPSTGKRCRILYLGSSGLFLHRDAHKDWIYEFNTYSPAVRKVDKKFRLYFGVDRAYKKIYSKHFRKYYKGKETKRYKKLLKEIEIGEQYNEDELINEANSLFANRKVKVG